jgi:phosphoribosyl 1,2-cyclic phosphate phosphodiesterase
MKGSFLFLGTGASTGVPKIGCKCAVCTSKDPRNQRLRPAGLLKVGGKTILIDVGPDFRQQALKAGIEDLDGLMLTHTHFDHIAGIDELRVFNFRHKKPFPILLSKESSDDLHKRYYYLFRERKEGDSLAVSLDCRVLPSESGEIEFLGIPVRYVSYSQASMKVNGFRIGSFAYVSDIREHSDEIFSALKGVDSLVLSALRDGPSPVHLSLTEAAAFAKKVGAKRTWLTHLSHSIDYETVSAKLPQGMQLGLDGLSLEFECSQI